MAFQYKSQDGGHGHRHVDFHNNNAVEIYAANTKYT